MTKRKKVEKEPESLTRQLESYVAEIVEEWEYATGLRIECIEIRHRRAIGFNQKERITVNVITE
jgi:hypothetical protein